MRHAPRPARELRPVDSLYAQFPGPPFLTVACPTIYAPLWWHTAGRSYTASGYGRRIPTTRMIQLPGSPVWRRVYVCCFSNSGTAYVEDTRSPKRVRPGGTVARYEWIVITD